MTPPTARARRIHSILIPGRHQLITRFQEDYLRRAVLGAAADDGARTILRGAPDLPLRSLDGEALECTGARLVFAITSADHARTRRNPVPLIRRVQVIERSRLGGAALAAHGIPSLVFAIDDVPHTARFALHVINAIAAAGGPYLDPSVTAVATSTPAVAALYAELGFAILGLEIDPALAISTPLRVDDCLAPIALDGVIPTELEGVVSDSTIAVFGEYAVPELMHEVYADPLGTDEGEITRTRDYRTYAASFDHSAARKFAQLRPHIHPGRIVDVGCGAGSLLAELAAAPELADSDLYGIEAARPLYEECLHRRRQGVFAGNANVFFHRRNILSAPIFPDASIDTTLTVALTHEIASYLGIDALRRLIDRIYAQTRPGGVWVNLDVLGPTDADRTVELRFRDGAGAEGFAPIDLTAVDNMEAALSALAPQQRLVQFAHDWCPDALPISPGLRHLHWSELPDGRASVTLSARLAMEWLSRDAYLDNWQSEMHESFCFWDGPTWTDALQDAGFVLEPASGPWRNEWLIDHRFDPIATLHAEDGTPREWPDTHWLAVARRPG